MPVRQVLPHHHWPSGEGRPILQLALAPEDLAQTTGLRFDQSLIDDLGEFRFAAFELTDGEEIWVGRYPGEPPGFVTAYADRGANVPTMQETLLSELGVPASAVSWRVTLDLDYVANVLALTVGASRLDAEQPPRPGRPVVSVDRTSGTAVLADPNNSAWRVEATAAGGRFAARVEGTPTSTVIRALAWLDFEAGFHLQVEPAKFRPAIIADQESMWPTWAAWKRACTTDS